jgi:hypothetical protein
VYVATPVVGEPVEEWLLAAGTDGQEIVDRLFWEIIQANWPPVVKTGCIHPSPTSPRRRPLRPRGGDGHDRVTGHHGRNRERSPPS